MALALEPRLCAARARGCVEIASGMGRDGFGKNLFEVAKARDGIAKFKNARTRGGAELLPKRFVFDQGFERLRDGPRIAARQKEPRRFVDDFGRSADGRSDHR